MVEKKQVNENWIFHNKIQGREPLIRVTPAPVVDYFYFLPAPYS